MELKKIIALLIVAASVPLASAGTPASPEITDAANDVPEAHLDVTRVWITNDASTIYVNIALADLVDPVSAGDYRALYRTQFTLASVATPVVIDGEIHVAASPSGLNGVSGGGAGLRVAMGSSVTANNGFSAKLTADQDASVLTLAIARAYFPTGPFSPSSFVGRGAVLSGLTIATGANDVPVSGTSGTTQTVLGAPWTIVDTTGSASYVVQ